MGLPAKRPGDSAVREQVYMVFPNDLNANGTVFGGQILALMDRYCAVVADRHADGVCVTVGMDAVHFIAPARRGDVLIFNAMVNRAWGTSMEVGCTVEAVDGCGHQRRDILATYLTFVATDTEGRPRAVAPLTPDDARAEQRFEEAQLRREMRLRHAADLKQLRRHEA